MKNSQRKKKIMKVTVVIGALIIPLLYSLFYLGAFWDPYARLDGLPVAVVNLDKGAEVNGESRNLGTEVSNELRQDASLKFDFTDEKTAREGLKGHKYYAAITIPADFSQKISTIGTENKEIATIQYAVNEKRNYLASQILNSAIQKIEGEVTSDLDREITADLVSKLEEVPESLERLDQGFAALGEGSRLLTNGSARLSGGAQILSAATGKLYGGTGGFAAGLCKLTKGSEDLQSGLDQLEQGLEVISSSGEKLMQLEEGIGELRAGTEILHGRLYQLKGKIDGALASYQENVNNYVEGYQALFLVTDQSGILTTLPPEQQAKLKALNEGAPGMTAGYDAMMAQIDGGLNTAIDGANEVNKGAARLEEGAKGLEVLKAGLLSLQEGVQILQVGSGQLTGGLYMLSENMEPLQSGVLKIDKGAKELQSGIGEMEEGAKKLENGILAGKNQVDERLTYADKEGKKLNGISGYAAKPLEISKEEIGYVPNYGTAFAPYFLSLSLWVGGLIIFFGIYLDVDKRYKYLCRDSENKVIRSFAYLILGVAQAMILAFVIKFALGLQVENLTLYVLSCILVSMVFISIIQFCLVHLGDMGKFVALLLLILQLTSCGGTFPMETVPEFFNALYPYMPMTYSVDLFKAIITGDTGGNMTKNLLVLIGVMIAAMAATILMSVMKKSVRQLRHARKQVQV